MRMVKSHSALRAPPFPGRRDRRWGYGLAGTCGLGLLLMSQSRSGGPEYLLSLLEQRQTDRLGHG